MAGQWHLDAETYLARVRAEIPSYDDLQHCLADATADVDVRAILDLGSGTGVTAAAVLARHPTATLTGVDASAELLEHARRAVPSATFLVQRLEDALPRGPFDVVVSAFAIHHLPPAGKQHLFRRVAAVLRPGGRFVMCDVVVPVTPVESPVPLEPHVDLPDRVDDQLRWLAEARLAPSLVLATGDLAVLRGDRA